MHAVLERVVCQIVGDVRLLDAEATQLHPGNLDYKWSAQQVVEHLVLGYRITSGALETRLTRGRPPRKQSQTFLQWSLQLMILSFGRLPRGVPALDETMPAPGAFAAMNGKQLGDLLCAEAERLDVLLDRCRSKFGIDRVATHPWLGPLRVDQWRRFHAVHGMHHIVQLRSVIQQVAPAAVPIRIPGPGLVKELQIKAQRPLA